MTPEKLITLDEVYDVWFKINRFDMYGISIKDFLKKYFETSKWENRKTGELCNLDDNSSKQMIKDLSNTFKKNFVNFVIFFRDNGWRVL